MLEQVTLKIEGVGNIVDDDVPVSKDEALNKTIRTFGEIKRPEKFYHHHEILHMIDGYEPEKGADVAGHRAYYLKGPGALLNMALVQYSTAFLAARDYCPVQPPFFMNKDIMAGIAQLGDFDEQLYHVQGEKGDEKYLIATSEQVCSQSLTRLDAVSNTGACACANSHCALCTATTGSQRRICRSATPV